MSLESLASFQLSHTGHGSQLKDHIYERSRRLFAQGDAQRDAAVASPEAVRQRQEALRSFVIESLGGLPASDTPLNACVRGIEQGNGFTIEKVVFEARPHQYVTANLYLPANRPERCPAILFLCGHSGEAKAYSNYQGVCQTLVQAGLIVLAQDPVGQGERSSYYDPERKQERVRQCTLDHDYAGAQCRFVGDNIARYFLHDAMRSIDYLISRPEVDPERIGVTGNSGGGTQTSLVMMADPRVAAAAPGTFIMSRDSYQRTGQPQDAEQIWPGFTEAGYDHEDILMAMTPRPVCVLAVTSDFFPIEGTRRTVERARRAWENFGVGGNLELAEDHSVHAYTPTLAKAAARFFSRHLLKQEIDPTPFSTEQFPQVRLQCTDSGQVKTDYPDAEFVFDSNLRRVREAEEERLRFSPEARKTRAIEWLRGVVFAHREASPVNPRLIHQRLLSEDLEADVALWYTQPYLANIGMLFRGTEPAAKKRGVTIALWDGGSQEIIRHRAWLSRECAKGRAVLVLNLSGMGPLVPDSNLPSTNLHGFYGTFHKLADDLTWIGDSLVALRTFEAVKAVEALEALATLWPDLDLGDLRFHAHGRHGVYARLASAVEPRLRNCEWNEGFLFADLVTTRYYDAHDIKSLILPGALRYFDLDELG